MVQKKYTILRKFNSNFIIVMSTVTLLNLTLGNKYSNLITLTNTAIYCLRNFLSQVIRHKDKSMILIYIII